MEFGAPSQIGVWLGANLRSLLPGWAEAMFLGIPLARKLQFDPKAKKLKGRFWRLTAPLDFVTSDVQPQKRTRKRVVDVFLPEDLFLKREITCPREVRSKLRTLAELDLRQHTPFRLGEVYVRLGPANVNGEDLLATQWVAKRADVDLWLQRLSKQGLRVRRIYVSNSDLTGPIADLTSEIARPRRVRVTNSLLGLAACACAAVALVFPVYTAQTQTVELDLRLATLRSEAVALRAEVETLRAQEAERAAFYDLLFRRPLLVETLRELTIALPDDVWLGGVEFRPERVVINGEATGSAADTVLTLSRNRKFGNPRISGQIARTATNAERFEITTDLGAGG